MGSFISGILGGGSSPGQEGQMAALKASRADIQRLRPELMQAKLNALGNATSAYQGTNNALETLWGAPQSQVGGPRRQIPGHPQASPQRMLGHDLPQGMPQQPMPPPQGQPDPNSLFFGGKPPGQPDTNSLFFGGKR